MVPFKCVISLLVLCEMFVLMGCDQDARKSRSTKISGPTMGTSFSVKITDIPQEVSEQSLDSDIKHILSRINDRMSTYDEESEVSRFNKLQTLDWFQVSQETIFVVKEALRVSELTQGAFDVTVGPLVNLWGFGPPMRSTTLPSDDLIKQAQANIGYHLIHTREVPPAIRKERPPVQIDLSAIAKGYAVDQIAEFLESRSIGNYLVEIGGEIRAKGNNAEGIAWKVAIEKPIPEQRAVHRVLNLDNHAIATSGDYRNYLEKDGTHFSHTINPMTGKPITHNLASVTVLSKSSMRADALATALMVLGPEQGFQLAERENLAALFLMKESEGFIEKTTSALDRSLFADLN